MDHRELFARVTVADVGGDVVARRYLPAVALAGFFIGGDGCDGAHARMISPNGAGLKPDYPGS